MCVCCGEATHTRAHTHTICIYAPILLLNIYLHHFHRQHLFFWLHSLAAFASSVWNRDHSPHGYPRSSGVDPLHCTPDGTGVVVVVVVLLRSGICVQGRFKRKASIHQYINDVINDVSENTSGGARDALPRTVTQD